MQLLLHRAPHASPQRRRYHSKVFVVRPVACVCASCRQAARRRRGLTVLLQGLVAAGSEGSPRGLLPGGTAGPCHQAVDGTGVQTEQIGDTDRIHALPIHVQRQAPELEGGLSRHDANLCGNWSEKRNIPR